MARAFNPESEITHLRLPLTTKRQIADLMADEEETATDAIVIAVAERHQRTFGQPGRDVLAELDDIHETLRIYKIRLDSIEDAA